MEAGIFLDTHVAIWLYAGETDKISPKARDYINRHSLFVSPMVVLELQYLYEVNKLLDSSVKIIAGLEDEGVSVIEDPFGKILNEALKIDWTRDVFDRIIAAHAIYRGMPLLSKDRVLREHKCCVW